MSRYSSSGELVAINSSLQSCLHTTMDTSWRTIMFAITLAVTCSAVHYERTDSYLNWLLKYYEYCMNETTLVSRCSEEYGKIYLFSDKRRSLSDSQSFCKEHFNMPSASDLVIFGSCNEYMYVQKFLLEIASRRDLWNQETGSKIMETWTKSDRIPAAKKQQPSPLLERGRVYKRSIEDEPLPDSEIVEDETDVSTCATNNTFVAPDITVTGNSSQDVRYKHRNLTTSFRPWDGDEGDETETRYPICQLKFDKVFWEEGRFKVVHEDDTTVLPIVVTTTEASAVTAPAVANVTTGAPVNATTAAPPQIMTEAMIHTTITVTTTQEPDTSAATESTRAITPSSPKSPPQLTVESTPASTEPSSEATSPVVVAPHTTSPPSHAAYYDGAHDRIRQLWKGLDQQDEEDGDKPPGRGSGPLDFHFPKVDRMLEANNIASDLVTHCKTDGKVDPSDVQSFISCMKNLHEFVTHVLAKMSISSEEDKQKEPLHPRASDAMRAGAIKFSTTAIDGFSTILELSDPWSKLDMYNRSESAIMMMTQVHHLSFTLGCVLSSDHQEITEENIKLEVFGIESGILGKEFSFPKTTNSGKKQSHIAFTSNVAVARNICGRHVASGIIYQNLASHMMPKELDVSVNSHLVAFSLSNSSDIHSLPGNSRAQISLIHLSPLKFGDVSQCVFWDHSKHAWSSDGCTRMHDLSTRNQTVCQCDHLTNFAVLMDISNREEDDEVKNFMTIICSSASIICLTLTIACILMFKSLRNRRSVITANLSACLLLSNLLVVFGFDQTDHLLLCQVISGLTLYSLLSAFMWMLMEGYLLYQMIILVFRSIGHLNTTTLYLIAYIPPAVTVGIFVAVTGSEGLFDPEYSYFCWVSNRHHVSYIWSFAGPALAIISVNAIILTRSFIAALASQTSRKPAENSNRSTSVKTNSSRIKSKLENIKRWLKGWTSLVILVGVTWVTGVLYIHESASWLSYVFICLNGLQGVLIFLFEIILNSKTRKAVIDVIRKRIPDASSYLRGLSKTSSNNLSNTSKTKSTNTAVSSRTESHSNLSRNFSLDVSCDHNFCGHVVTEPDGKDMSPHHLFHHHHEVPKLVTRETFTKFHPKTGVHADQRL